MAAVPSRHGRRARRRRRRRRRHTSFGKEPEGTGGRTAHGRQEEEAEEPWFPPTELDIDEPLLETQSLDLAKNPKASPSQPETYPSTANVWAQLTCSVSRVAPRISRRRTNVCRPSIRPWGTLKYFLAKGSTSNSKSRLVSLRVRRNMASRLPTLIQSSSSRAPQDGHAEHGFCLTLRQGFPYGSLSFKNALTFWRGQSKAIFVLVIGDSQSWRPCATQAGEGWECEGIFCVVCCLCRPFAGSQRRLRAQRATRAQCSNRPETCVGICFLGRIMKSSHSLPRWGRGKRWGRFFVLFFLVQARAPEVPKARKARRARRGGRRVPARRGWVNRAAPLFAGGCCLKFCCEFCRWWVWQ